MKGVGHKAIALALKGLKDRAPDTATLELLRLGVSLQEPVGSELRLSTLEKRLTELTDEIAFLRAKVQGF